VSSPTDTSNFDVDDTDIRISDAVPPTANAAFTGLHLPFVGFTFTQGSSFCDLSSIPSDLAKGLIPSSNLQTKKRLKQLEEENAQLQKKLQGMVTLLCHHIEKLLCHNYNIVYVMCP
jgi:serine/threonine-protein kinase MRCK